MHHVGRIRTGFDAVARGSVSSAGGTSSEFPGAFRRVELTSKLQDLAPILSIAPQSLASLAALHDLTLEEVLHGLRAFFKTELGFKLVFDTTFARSISLAENRLEFLERRSHALQSSAPTAVSLAESSLSPSSSSTGPLPILSSACPGWVCYAEKTHGELLPFVSNVKSEQAVMGTLVKGGQVAKHLRLKYIPTLVLSSPGTDEY